MSGLAIRGAGGMPVAIGRYRVVGRLGKGAMGIVYSGRDDQLERDVALKVMMTDLEGDPETRARFYREAQITGKLLHRNIITVFDLGEEDGRLYLVMELLKGRTLTEFLKDPESQSLEQKLDLMIQSCDGLSSAHAKGIVHRDVKPNNLFVQSDGALKILDFGIARLASSNMTASGLIMGTPDYMSPEQAQGKEVDARSDVFSAAGVFYLMLTGRRPFEAAELPVVLQKVVREDPLPIRTHEAPPALAQIVEKALQKDPNRRYQRCADMAADLIRFRRSFEAETRRLVASAKESFDRAEQLLSRVAQLREDLGLQVSPAVNQERRSLGERFPFFSAEPDRDDLGVAPMKRVGVMAMLDELNAALVPLSSSADALALAVDAAASGEQALKRKDVRLALTEFERAASAAEESPRITIGLEAARAAVVTMQERADRVRALIEEARMAESSGDWPAAMDLCAQVLTLEPQRSDVRALMSSAEAALEAAKQARVRRVQMLLAQATRAVQDSKFEEADRVLSEAHALGSDEAGVEAVRSRLDAARMAAAAADARARHAASELVEARRLFEGGDRDAAIRRLEGLGRDDPGAAGVDSALRALKTEAERLAADERRHADADAHAHQAGELWERGEVDQALRASELALSLVHTHPDALRIHGLAKTRRRELAETAARAAQVEALVTRARTQLSAHRYAKAISDAQEALNIEPGRADAALVVSDARRLETEEQAAREKREAANLRDREVEKILKAARKDLHNGEPNRAAWAAENALIVSPEDPRAMQVLAEARAAIEAAERNRPDPDATVQLSRDRQTALDPAATVVLPVGSQASRGAVSVWMSRIRRRLRAEREPARGGGSRRGNARSS